MTSQQGTAASGEQATGTKDTTYALDRSRNAGYPATPAQIRT